MVQSYFVGVFFCVGLVAGVFITFILSTSANVGMGRPTGDDASLAMTVDPSLRAFPSNLTAAAAAAAEGGLGRQGVFINRPPLSHEEVDSIPGPSEPVKFGDSHEHHDDDAKAKELYSQVRVLCWIMTSPDNLRAKAIHVNATWAKRCNKVLYMSDVEDKEFPAVGVETGLGRDHLTAKTMRAFDYVYRHHYNDADWFMKADDDTYVIVENLRYMLSAHEPTEPIFFGHHFKVIVTQGYFSGGAGYVMSKEALRRFGERPQGLCAEDAGAEDVEMGRCMEKLKVTTGDSRDALGRSRFHCFNPETHLHGGYPDWYLAYDKYGANKGIESMSDYSVSFHYVSVNQLYDLEFYIYHLSPYGLLNGLQDLNGPVREKAIPAVRTTSTTTTAAPVEAGAKEPEKGAAEKTEQQPVVQKKLHKPKYIIRTS